jgi:ligand-binding sensor domain-containing protein
MSGKFFTTIFLCLLPLICFSGVWQNYDNISVSFDLAQRTTLIPYDGFIWGTSGSGIWRFDPKTDEQIVIYPADWSESGGRIYNHFISKNGDHWFVMTGIGIVRYDGINWQFFDSEDLPGTPSSTGGIAEDSSGTIWFVSGNGLINYDGNKWKYLDKINDTPITPKPKQICSDKEGTIWLAYLDTPDNEFLARKIGDNWSIYPMPSDYNFYNSEYRIYADNEGGIWFTGVDSDSKVKIFRFYDGVFSPMQNGGINSFASGNDGSAWIRYGKYVSRIKGEEWTNYEPKTLFPEIPHPGYGEITSLPDGSTWIVISDGDLYVPIGFVVIKEGEMFRHDVPLSSFLTTTKNLSLRNKHGVFTSDSNIFEINDIYNPDDFITLEFNSSGGGSKDLLIDSSDRIWWAAQQTFISFSDGSPTYHYKESWWPKNGMAYALAEGVDGTLWLATSSDLFSQKNDQWTDAVALPPNNNYTSIAVDTSGTVWLANGGISKYDGNELTNVAVPESGQIYYISADSKGGVWAAGFSNDPSVGGLYYIQGENITRYTKENGLPSQHIKEIEVSPDDSVWFSFRDIKNTMTSSGGIGHFNGTNIEVYRTKDGLGSYSVNDIAVSNVGIVWFATDDGLSTLDLNATPDPKIRTGVNKHILKEGDKFRLGVNLQNRGPVRDVKLVLALLYQGRMFMYDFTSGQFTNSYHDIQIPLPENLKATASLWKLEVPAGFEGISCSFASALFDAKTSNLIGDISVEKIEFTNGVD